MSDSVLVQTVVFCVQNLLAASAAYMFAARAFRGCERSHVALAAVAGYPLVVYLTVLPLGSAGLLSIGLILIFLLLLNALLIWGPGLLPATSREKLRADAPPGHGKEPPAGPANPIAAGIALALVVVFVLPPAIRLLVKGPSYSSDDLSYHASSIAHWLVEGKISLVGSSLSTYYPFNSEILSLWHMFPFHADGLVGLVGIFWIGLLAFTVFSLTRKMDVSLSVSAACLALMIASPVVAASAGRFSAVDFAGAAAMLCALTFFLDSRQPAILSQRRRADLLYGGLLAGFAAGVKVPLAIPGAVILLWLLVSRGEKRMSAALLTGSAMLVAGGYWYIRNLVYTGNPVYPAESLVFSGPFGTAEQTRTQLVTWIAHRPLDVQQWKFILRSVFDWPLGLGILAFTGYAGALWALSRRNKGLAPFQMHFLLLLGLIGIVSVLIFPFMPFSGTDNDPYAVLRVEPRFLILPFFLGIILWSTVWGRTQRGQRVFFALSLVAAIGAWDGQSEKLALLLGATAAFLVIPKRFWESALRVASGVRGGTAAVVLVFAAVLLLEPIVQRNADTAVFSYRRNGQPIGEVWRAVNSLPPNSRIACIGPAAQQSYPVFGRQLDKVPVQVQGDGTVTPLLHDIVRASDDSSSYWSPEPPARTDHLVANLRRMGAHYLLVTKEDAGAWPGPHEVLLRTPGATQVFNNGYASLWKLPGGN